MSAYPRRIEMPRLISSLCRSVRSPVRRSVRVLFPWSTWPTTPTFTAGWARSFIGAAPPPRPRDLGLAPRQAEVEPVDLVPDFLADERVRVVSGDISLERPAGLGVRDHGLELRHGETSRYRAGYEPVIKGFWPVAPGVESERCAAYGAPWNSPRIPPSSSYVSTIARPSFGLKDSISSRASVICWRAYTASSVRTSSSRARGK